MNLKLKFSYRLLLMSVLPAALGAVSADSIVTMYKAGRYGKVCKEGMRRYYNGDKEPHFAAMVGMACARTDAINPLGVLQRSLVASPPLRSSATYFSTLVLAKRLLYQHFVDGTPIAPYVLPRYDHVLSIVFEHVRRGDYRKVGEGMIRIDTPNGHMFVSVSDDDPPRLLVDEYNGAERRRRHGFQ